MRTVVRELLLLLRERRRQWLRPLLILALLLAGVLALASGLPQALFAPATADHLAPFSRGHYRHERAWLTRYSAISWWPRRLG
jgi:hypothetical protein